MTLGSILFFGGIAGAVIFLVVMIIWKVILHKKREALMKTYWAFIFGEQTIN